MGRSGKPWLHTTGEIIALVRSELAKLIRYDLCTLTLFNEPHVCIHFHATLSITHLVHNEEVIHIAISLGVASTGTPDVTHKEDLIRAADAALYRAKDAGRNRYCVAHGGEVFHCSQDVQPLNYKS